MTRKLRLALLAAALFMSGLAHAEIDTKVAEELMHKAGLWDQLGQMGAQAEAGFAQRLKQSDSTATSSEAQRASAAMGRAFGPELLRATSTKVLAQNLKPEQVATLLRWFDSPQGQAVRQAEVDAAKKIVSPDASMREGRVLFDALPDARKALLVRMVQATRSAEFMLETSGNIAIAMMQGARLVQPESAAVTESEIRAQLAAQRPQMLTLYAAFSIASFATMYQDIPMETLQAYADFLESEVGRHFNDVTLQAVNAAFIQGAKDLGQRLPGTKDASNV
ncbi:hypothetical protein [Variovorax sp. HJSM1_2]|uniref:hypothetical protein n=1 Tax=Variovorax sp. HJSM1_2 TaxID=3366263 RepID=UPI003BDF7B62